MTTITPNQGFKHEGKSYEKGESYEVPPEQAYYFKMCGWLEGTEPQTGQVHNLEVQDSVLGQQSEVK